MLLSRDFLQKIMRVNFRNFHTVQKCNIVLLTSEQGRGTKWHEKGVYFFCKIQLVQDAENKFVIFPSNLYFAPTASEEFSNRTKEQNDLKPNNNVESKALIVLI